MSQGCVWRCVCLEVYVECVSVCVFTRNLPHQLKLFWIENIAVHLDTWYCLDHVWFVGSLLHYVVVPGMFLSYSTCLRKNSYFEIM